MADESQSEGLDYETREITECAYCGQSFDSEHERGVHQAEEHVDTSSKITKSKGDAEPYENIVDDYRKNAERGRGKNVA